MKTVFISGNFNILHPGHIRLFKFARECGDKVIIGIFGDNLVKEKNYLKEDDRMESVKSISIVDEVHVIKKSLQDTINRIKPDIVLKGKEHENLYNEELNILKKFKGKLIFASGSSSLSSTNLINRELSDNKTFKISFPQKFMKRHNITKNKLTDLLSKFKNLNVCVIGDLIIDEYVHCDTLGMSHEDSTIVVSPSERKKFIGGSGIVAAHAAGLGAKVNYITVVGKDSEMKFAEKKLASYGVNTSFFEDESRPTTVKQRFINDSKSLLRVSNLQQHAISESIQDKITLKLKKFLKNTDILIFSDFNYGSLPQRLLNKIEKIKKKKSIICVADSQSSSQTGNIARFMNMDLILPTEREARISLRNNEDGLAVISDKLMKEAKSRYIILKLGSDGLLVEDSFAKGKGKINDWYTDRLTAFNSNPVDVAGAGDSLMVGSSLVLAAGGNIWEGSLIGSIMASIQVSRQGNIPIKVKELFGEFN